MIMKDFTKDSPIKPVQMRKTETTDALKGLVGALCQTNPVTAVLWGLFQEQETAKWRYRVDEFLTYVSDGRFVKDLLEDEQFQDGLALAFRAYVQQRNEKKRDLIKKVFMGFAEEENKEDFELERIFDVIEKISFDQMKMLKKVSKDGTLLLISNNIFSKDIDVSVYAQAKYLESLGLLYIEFHSEAHMEEGIEKMGSYADNASFFANDIPPMKKENIVKLETSETLVSSDFGKEFIQYIQE